MTLYYDPDINQYDWAVSIGRVVIEKPIRSI